MHNLGGAVWAKAIYDGIPTSDSTTSDGAFGTHVDIDATCPRILFIVHGVKAEGTGCEAGSGSDSVMYWEIMAQTTYAKGSDADFTDYTAITGATAGVITLAASDTVMGPFIIDLNVASVGSSGSLLFHAYSSDAVTLAVHAVALGYGGTRSSGSDYIAVG